VGGLEILQFRGFIKCPKCGKLLTESASRDLLLSGDLDGVAYKEVKFESERKITYLDGGERLYIEADTKRKREIIG
jgi:hypothetical protein